MSEYLKIQTWRPAREEDKPGTEVGYTSSCVNGVEEEGDERGRETRKLSAFYGNTATVFVRESGGRKALKQWSQQVGKQETYKSQQRQ